MATKDQKEDKYGDLPEELRFKARRDYQEDWTIHRDYIQDFDAYEAMLLGYVWDSVSNSIDTSKITDSYAATLAIERAARVMGKLPEGETEGDAKGDAGKGAFMDILRQKWYYPNANAQHSFKTKLRLWQLYSSIYGYMPMFYDWNVTDRGYIGPDCWLWNPRNLVPQQGRISIADMDYVTALTWVGKKFLRAKLDKSLGEDKVDNLADGKPTKQNEDDEDENDGWNLEAVQLLLDIVDNETRDVDNDKDTVTTRSRVNQSQRKGICLATRYEAGEDGCWVTFAPDHGYVEVRRIKNPHKNGKIPFVIKYSLPLFDSFYGMGDFQRQKPLQFARDGVTNFYFKGIKMSLVRPIVANINGVVKHTLDYREGAVMLETQPNSIRTLEVGNGGLSTYQAAMSALTGQQLAQVGSQNASIPGAESLNPSQGKTPQAIDLYSEKEATRDGQEREMLETALEELIDGFNSLVVNIGTESIPINLFTEDIQDIVDAGQEDILKLFKNWKPNKDQDSGKLEIDPKELKGVEYRFNITPGSTAKLSKEKQRQSLADWMAMVGKFQNVIQDSSDVQWEQIMSDYGKLADLPNASKYITPKQGPSEQELALMQQLQEAQQQNQELQSQSQEAQTALQDHADRTVGGNIYNDPAHAEAAKRLEML